jgi:hypothetical protein
VAAVAGALIETSFDSRRGSLSTDGFVVFNAGITDGVIGAALAAIRETLANAWPEAFPGVVTGAEVVRDELAQAALAFPRRAADVVQVLLDHAHEDERVVSAATEVVRYVFDVRGEQRVTALIDAPNTASLRVAAHLGMTHEADTALFGKPVGRYVRAARG